MNQKQATQALAAFLSVGLVYRLSLLALAGVSFRKGHWFLGLIGFFFPILWVAGALLPRKDQHA